MTTGGRPSVRTLRMHSFAAEYSRVSARAIAAGARPDEVVLPAQGLIRASDGTRLHYLEWPGPYAAPLLLFLHGGGLHAHTFDVTALLMRSAGRRVALDLRGHGDSDWAGPGGYGTEVIAADIEAVVRSLIAQRPLFADLEEAESFVTGHLPTREGAATSGVALSLTWAGDGSLTWKHDTRQFQPGTVAGPEDLRQAARQVACPALVLRGERRRVFSDAGAAELACLIPGARWQRVPAAGHNIQSGNPRGLADALIAFLAQHNLGAYHIAEEVR